MVQVGPTGPQEGSHTSGFRLSNRSSTLPLATRYNVRCVGLSPDGRLAIIVDEGNYPLSRDNLAGWGRMGPAGRQARWLSVT